MSTPVVPDAVNAYPVHGPVDGPVIGDSGPDSDGAMWWWQNLDGWFGTTAIDAAFASVGNSDYATAAPRFPRKPREITITGVCLAPSLDDAMYARDRLAGTWGDPNTEFTLQVDEPVPKWATVRMSGQLLAPWPDSYGHGAGFGFSIPLTAADGLKYGLPQRIAGTDAQTPGIYAWTFTGSPTGLRFSGSPTGLRYSGSNIGGAGRLTLFNGGYAPSPPVSTIRGPLPSGWTMLLESTGEWLTVGSALGAGTVLDIDHRAQRMTVAGQDVSIQASGTFFSIPPGEQTVRFLADTYNASATLTMSCYDAYR